MISENFLVTTADCPECLSKNTLFFRFDGVLLRSESGKGEGIKIRGEIHRCKGCSNEFIKRDGPWIGLKLSVWAEAMKNSLPYEKVIEYTSFIRERLIKQ